MVGDLLPMYASPLLILGIPLILFSDRNMDHHRQNMREGKEYIWQERFSPAIGSLIHHLDANEDLIEGAIRLKTQFQDSSQDNPDGISSLDDIPKSILRDSAFTPDLKDITESIAEHSRKMQELQRCYNSLDKRLRNIGISLVLIYIIGVGGFYASEESFEAEVIILVLLLMAVTSYLTKLYIEEKSKLREYADKYEGTREI